SSGKNALLPAARSTTTSWPPLTSFPATSGLRATRRSFGATSFGTPMRIRLGSARESRSVGFALLREHPFGEVDALSEIVELLAQPVQLCFQLVHAPLGAGRHLPHERRCLDTPVPHRQLLGVAHFAG